MDPGETLLFSWGSQTIMDFVFFKLLIDKFAFPSLLYVYAVSNIFLFNSTDQR